jgi:phosphate acyltransferase
LITIALDAIGGDHGVKVTVPSAISVLKKQHELRLILVGNEAWINSELSQHKSNGVRDRLLIHHATQVVDMDEAPVAINLVKQGEADAAISAGNTGALMATARFVLKTLPGIDRPAIITTIPTMHGHVHMLDMGANVDCTPDMLVQFAVMGSILVSAIEGKAQPKVGLLNIGEEDIKGNEVVKQAAELLRVSKVNYCGYAEGNEIYTGDFDVIVCDGFVGNVALKTSEGLAQMISHYMRQEFRRNPLTIVSGILALPVLHNFRRRVDPRRYNGATLIGLNGIVIKSHGSADALAFEHAILGALLEVNKQVPRRISQGLRAMLQTN